MRPHVDRTDRRREAVDVEPTAAPPAPSAPVSSAALLAMQRSAGNVATARALAVARNPFSGIGDAIGDVTNTRPDEARLDAQEELADFRAATYPPLEDYEPSSGTGQFDAVADMSAGTLTITLKVGYSFVPGDPAKVSAGFRPADFQWAPAEVTAWKARYQRELGAMWSVSTLMIQNTKPYWQTMTVATTVEVVEDAADPHYKLTVAKYPPDAEHLVSSVCGQGMHDDGTGTGNCVPNTDPNDESGTGDLDSNDLRSEQKLDWGNPVVEIPFAEASSRLGPAGTAPLAPVIASVAGVAGAHVELTGRASAKPAAGLAPADAVVANMDLARARTAAVEAALLGAGATPDQLLIRNVGETDATAGAEWCRVDTQVGTHDLQVSAGHEAGHMLGSDDEYDDGQGTPLDPDYDAMIQAQTGDIVARADSGDIMSDGNVVRRWNYAAFLEALEKITGETEWTL